MILFNGKLKNLTPKELFLAWNYGRLVERIESADFGRN